MLALHKVIWKAWKGFSHKLISAQNAILMAAVYIFAVAPVAVVFKLIGKRLVSPPEIDPEAESYWEAKEDGRFDMEKAQRMF
ncbi:MAG: hypothetical protein VX899_01965 [Myxococcota bacterium]|nr:hypothetical protein [Myxococcota bacterium]